MTSDMAVQGRQKQTGYVEAIGYACKNFKLLPLICPLYAKTGKPVGTNRLQALWYVVRPSEYFVHVSVAKLL